MDKTYKGKVDASDNGPMNQPMFLILLHFTMLDKLRMRILISVKTKMGAWNELIESQKNKEDSTYWK